MGDVQEVQHTHEPTITVKFEYRRKELYLLATEAKGRQKYTSVCYQCEFDAKGKIALFCCKKSYSALAFFKAKQDEVLTLLFKKQTYSVLRKDFNTMKNIQHNNLESQEKLLYLKKTAHTLPKDTETSPVLLKIKHIEINLSERLFAKTNENTVNAKNINSYSILPRQTGIQSLRNRFVGASQQSINTQF